MHPRLLAGRYELISVLASGGMGRVWRGRDTLLDRPVAVKVLREDVAGGDPTSRARLRTEAQHAAALTSPHIAALYDYGETSPGTDGTRLPFLVMELVPGESLAALLRRRHRLDVGRTLDLVRQAADGLAAAHAAGVVHRDVKPANLMVRPDGVLKITDFGIARSAASASVTVTGQVMGTAQYLSPEQASGQPSTPASDVYALGLVAYECLAGRPAFTGDNPVQVAVQQIREEPPPLPAGIPGPVRALVERAIAKDPAARFADGAALRDAVDRVPAGSPTARPGIARTAVLPTLAAPAAASRRRWLLPAAVALTVLVLAAVVLGVALSGRSTPAGRQQPASSTTASATVQVDADAFVGRPVADVQAALAGRGLHVELVPMETTDVPDGQVMAVEPAGALSPGRTVRISYAVAPTTAPTPAPPVVTTTAPAPPHPGPGGKPDKPDGKPDKPGKPGHGNG